MTEFEQLAHEHQVLLRQHALIQTRCSVALARQAAEAELLQAQVIRLRAAVIVRESALAFAQQDRAQADALTPGLPRRVTLARRVEALMARVQSLTREVLHWQWRATARRPAVEGPAAQTAFEARSVLCIVGEDADAPEPIGARPGGTDPLEASLAAADLVICQVGCVGHDDYWRVEDHCRRTGKTCVLVDQPQWVAAPSMRIHWLRDTRLPRADA